MAVTALPRRQHVGGRARWRHGGRGTRAERGRLARRGSRAQGRRIARRVARAERRRDTREAVGHGGGIRGACTRCGGRRWRRGAGRSSARARGRRRARLRRWRRVTRHAARAAHILTAVVVADALRVTPTARRALHAAATVAALAWGQHVGGCRRRGFSGASRRGLGRRRRRRARARADLGRERRTGRREWRQAGDWQVGRRTRGRFCRSERADKRARRRPGRRSDSR
mmetsp:Transcript_7652/g.31075  ORF Transcript_7652/g.31075 Transcript_7652/m.31075 type:complete len:228 (+) Transcript_7652:1119-1802(+)